MKQSAHYKLQKAADLTDLQTKHLGDTELEKSRHTLHGSRHVHDSKQNDAHRQYLRQVHVVPRNHGIRWLIVMHLVSSVEVNEDRFSKIDCILVMCFCSNILRYLDT